MTAMLTIQAPTLQEAWRVVSDENNFIGSGDSRNVYREPGSYWAFKVCNNDSFEAIIANENEYDNYVMYRDSLPAGIEFPRMVLLEYTSDFDEDCYILAVEFIEADREPSECHRGFHFCEDDPTCWAMICEMYKLPIEDLHCENVIHKGNILYIIDAQA
jgi:hypothetical protein